MFDSRGTAIGSPNHGGLTPAALACVFGQPLDNARFSRHSDRFTNHGGLTPAALVERASVQREWRYFSGDWRRAPGAAGVSQPWRTIGSCVVNVITPRKPLAVAGAVTEPRRADARRSFWARVCASKKSFFADERALCNARAGGVSPPWYVLGMRTRLRESHALPLQTRFAHPRRADARRSWLRVRQPLDNVRFSRHSIRLPNHGGLTPAALACVFGQPLDNVRFSRYSDWFTEPRRADARRSRERAFVHREWRYLSANRRRVSRSAG
jgi:hypothetical protein